MACTCIGYTRKTDVLLTWKLASCSQLAMLKKTLYVSVVDLPWMNNGWMKLGGVPAVTRSRDRF